MRAIGNILLVIGAVFWTLITFYNPRVSSEELAQLSEKASGSPAATELLKVFLADNPTPKMKEIRKVRVAIEEDATMRTAQEIAGNPNLASGPAEEMLAKIRQEKRAKAEQATAQAAFDQKVTSTSFWNLSLEDKIKASLTTYFPTVVKVGMGLMLLNLLVFLPLWMQSIRRG